VTHLRLRVGDYANVGQPRVAIVDSDSFWVTGYFEETKLRRIHVGDPARIRLMAYDAPVLGHVESIGRGISDPNDQISSRGLPTVSPIFTWVRLAQRVPVRIVIDQIPPGIELVAGLTASISLGTDATPRQTPQGRLLTWLEDNL
jgi:multidrug resistance efflux pump